MAPHFTQHHSTRHRKKPTLGHCQGAAELLPRNQRQRSLYCTVLYCTDVRRAAAPGAPRRPHATAAAPAAIAVTWCRGGAMPRGSPERSVQPCPAGKYHPLQRGRRRGGGKRWQRAGTAEMPSLSLTLKYQGGAGGIKQNRHLTQLLRQNQRPFLSRLFPHNGSLQPLARCGGEVRGLLAARALPEVILSGCSSVQ